MIFIIHRIDKDDLYFNGAKSYDFEDGMMVIYGDYRALGGVPLNTIDFFEIAEKVEEE